MNVACPVFFLDWIVGLRNSNTSEQANEIPLYMSQLFNANKGIIRTINLKGLL